MTNNNKEQKKDQKNIRTKEKKITSFLPKLIENPWKTAFISLIAILFGFSLVLVYRISTPRMNSGESIAKVVRQEDPILDVNMKKEQVNSVINFFLEDAMKESGVDYSFILENEALIEGTFSLLGHETHFYLYFEPYVLSDGNVQLKAKSLSVGSLSVPIPAMMNYISSTTELADWIEIDADKRTIDLHLDKFQMANGMSIKAKKINLIDDDIAFSIYLPKENTKEK